MQSAPPQDPNASASSFGFLKNPGYYLWLAAIGAIVYAYVFATSRADMKNKTPDSQEEKDPVTGELILKRDPATGKPMVNTGHRVLLLLPFVWLYTVLTKMFTTITFEYHSMVFAFICAGLIVITLIGLVFVSIMATQTTDGTLTFENAIYGKSDERKGFFWTNMALMMIFGITSLIAWFNWWDPDQQIFTALQFGPIYEYGVRFIFNFWFPLVMMYYFIKTGATTWFQIVAGVSIAISILMLLYNLYKIYSNKEPLNDWLGTFVESLRTTWNTFPLAPYLKYVEDTDLIVVAKRVLIFALLCYVAYLMNTVYKFKNRLVPCMSSSFASCFWNPDFKIVDYDTSKTIYDPRKTTPYVNALFYTLMLSMLANILNFVIKLFSLNTRINEALKDSSTQTRPTTFLNRFMLNHLKPEPPSFRDKFSLVTLIQMILFPFYWTLKTLVQHPIVTIIAFVAFAALGVMLYRSSFDLTDFIEGQRGTVITLFTMFIASLIVFGVYTASDKGLSGTSGTSGTTSTSSASGPGSGSASGSGSGGTSYGQFILRPLLLIAVALCVVGLLMFFLTGQSRLTTMANLLQYAITMMIYIGGIAIVIGFVRTVFSTSRKMGDSMFQTSENSNWVINVLKLIGNALFYLPCLLIDGVDMLKEQYGLTTRPILILLAMEAAFILAGHFLPALVTKAINHTGVQILSAPISMTKETKLTRHNIQFVNSQGQVAYAASDSNPLPPLSTPEPTAPNPTSMPNVVQLYNYRYGVSAWIYIHPQPPNLNSVYSPNVDASNNITSYDKINVFNFGGSLGPNVSYIPKTNVLNVKIAGTDKDDIPIPPITNLPLQTWNNVVINSDKGAIDILINGKLIYTGTHIPVIKDDANAISSVIIGAGPDDVGVQGEICNMVLNREPFTKSEITWFYETNKMLNPPVVGVNPDPLNQGDSADYLASQSVSNGIVDNNESNVDKTDNNPMSLSTHGAKTYGFLGAFFGAIFGCLFNDANGPEAMKGFFMGAVVFGLIGALLGALFSTDGTVAYVFKTIANVFVNTF